MSDNLSSRAVTALAAVQSIGDTMPTDHPMRHQVRSLKRAAEKVLWDAVGSAYDLAMAAEQVVSDFDKAVIPKDKNNPVKP